MKNRVHPELREMFSVLPEVDNSPENFQQYRKWAKESFTATVLLSNDEVTVSNRFIPGPERAPEVRVRIYEPTKKQKLYLGSFGYTVVDIKWDHPKWMTNFVKSSYWKPTV